MLNIPNLQAKPTWFDYSNRIEHLNFYLKSVMCLKKYII